MSKRVGYAGGKSGTVANYPAAYNIMLIVRNTNEIITSFPYQ
jgi:hypothetical protein